MKHISFIDTEVSREDQKAYDYGAVKENDEKLHTGSAREFHAFIAGAEYLCGHNIINHDLKYIEAPAGAVYNDTLYNDTLYIDTLYLSPLLFPNRPYHALVKDEKLQTEELNNPLNDALKARELFYDEVNAFAALDRELQQIYYLLLHDSPYFAGFFRYLDFCADGCAVISTAGHISLGDQLQSTLINLIFHRFSGQICEKASFASFLSQEKLELAYCIALLSATEKHSLIPRWVLRNYPKVDTILRILTNTSCHACEYCRTKLNPKRYLQQYFGYPDFRTYNGEPLQESAVRAAAEHHSLLAIFPTGGGKSLTFQIPALMAGEMERALTVVISPLQSLMKDQVDNLEKRGIAEAVTINGLLSPLERAEAIERVESGIASILYISPESLRSVTIERLFLSRHIDRFVIDEAHCFSAWGQDFRVDYLYIGDFIRELQKKKGEHYQIPVSCFTATAKQKVISDIKEYFKEKLGIELALFTTNASRTNLRYEVLYKETDEEKYETLRTLIEQKNCPTIVYVSRTKRTRQLAEKLCRDGFSASAFNGKMDSSEKQKNQEAFINDEIQVMVATSAFGMGVDKANVKLVIHYDISDSLENYVQEAGRAGRDENLQAECYVLFNDSDLDKHFMLLNQTKLSISEIQQVWRAVKELTGSRREVCCSPLEIARQAGWDDSVSDIETRVKTAVQALENAGYLKRGKNVPKVYADSILARNFTEAAKMIDEAARFQSEEERTIAKRIIRSLISSKSIAKAGNADAESRVDYLADRLGIEKEKVLHAIQQMREEEILADAKDLTAYIRKKDTMNKSMNILRRFKALEQFMLGYIDADRLCMNYKELNEAALAAGVAGSSVNAIKMLFYYWTIRSYIQKEQDSAANRITIVPGYSMEQMREKRLKSYQAAEYVLWYLFQNSKGSNEKEEVLVDFSIKELMDAYKSQFPNGISENEVEEALLFLSKIGAIKLEGGFLVLYSGMNIKRLIMDNKIRYKREDYRQLDAFYKQKIQQIHIVGEYANMMVRSYEEALQFVNDYFQMDYKKFLAHYFAGDREKEIERNITPAKYTQLFEILSARQREIISDNSSKHIVIAAGPGSGKTRVLVHKLASLLIMEDVKHEQLLMLTFSRAAAIEFKKRLQELIGNAAHFVEIKTFHSYCFDLLGKIGSLGASKDIVKDAVELLAGGDVDPGKITKTVLVIDEAQDMDENEFALVERLMAYNDEMRVIAVGDDDQNIYHFRGSDSCYMKMLLTKHQAVLYSLVENYRSCAGIVAFANRFVKSISGRMKNEDIIPVTGDAGEVKLIKHTGSSWAEAVVNDVLITDVTGTTCILTATNDEALLLLGILHSRNVPAKLIQSLEGFDIYNLTEIRYFLKCLDKTESSPVISDEQWNTAMEQLQNRYVKSNCLPLVSEILNTFSDGSDKKYRTDFELFLHESEVEDFYHGEQGSITISTMHKAKGREFDNVFLLLEQVRLQSDEDRRRVYVGMTRAKKRLHIHYSGNAFDGLAAFATSRETDNCHYPAPDRVLLQLSYKDVYLDFFKDKKELIRHLRSGMRMAVKGNRLYVRKDGRNVPVLQFSADGSKKLGRVMKKGYVPVEAVVRWICEWMSKEEKAMQNSNNNLLEETPVILADVIFWRKNG